MNMQQADGKVNGVNPLISLSTTEANEVLAQFKASDLGEISFPANGALVLSVSAGSASQPGTSYTNKVGELYGKVSGVLNLNLAVKVMKKVKDAAGEVIGIVAKEFGQFKLPRFRMKIEHEPDGTITAGKRNVVVVNGVYTDPDTGKQTVMYFKVMRQITSLELEPLTLAEWQDYQKAQSFKAEKTASKAKQ